MNSISKSKITNYTKFSKKVFEELNFARNNPKMYAKKLSDMKENLKGNVLKLNEYELYISEGVIVFDEALEFLKVLPNPTKLNLCWSQEIAKSAEELLCLLIIHEGIEGMSEIEKSKYDLDKRLNHFGAAFGELDEFIDYGSCDPEHVVINFLLCDGDPERKERKILFNPLVKYCGVSAGMMISNRFCTVIDFAEYYYGPGDVIPQSILQKFTNINLNSNKKVIEVEPEVKTRRRNDSTKVLKEKEINFKEKNSNINRGVINLGNISSQSTKNETHVKFVTLEKEISKILLYKI